MKINEYKDSVGSIRLSEEFKQELKQKMLLEAQSHQEKPEIKMTVGEFSKKHSKYISLAACLLLAVSTVAALSASRNTFKISKDSNINSSALDQYENDDTLAADSSEDYEPSVENDDYAIAMSDTPEDALVIDEPVEFPSAHNASSPDTVTESGEIEGDIPEPVTEPTSDQPIPQAQESVPEAKPCTSANGYSPYASSEYEGRYYGEDYVIGEVVGSARFKASSVVEKIAVNAKVIEFTDVNALGGGDSVNGVPVESPDEIRDEVEAESAAYDDNDTETAPAAPAAPITLKSFEELTSGESKEYYDIRDGVLANLDNIGLIRFTIIDGYETPNAIASNAPGFKMDPDSQILYKINVSYDYFNSEDADTNRLLLNTGNTVYQLVGRPAMEGEYIAVVTENYYGILEPVPQLIYAVHKVNGLDIAYHLYSDDGFMVDPGHTNMGLMPEEQTVVNSTVNNPEIYTQKAAVRELTYYLKRNIMRMEPKVLDFSKKNEEQSATEASVDAPAELRKLIRAVFPEGKLRLSALDTPLEVGKYTSDDTEGLKVNGIGVGADMADALSAFFLTKYSFTPDAKITLCAHENEGSWFVIVTFSENVVSKIEVFE